MSGEKILGVQVSGDEGLGIVVSVGEEVISTMDVKK